MERKEDEWIIEQLSSSVESNRDKAMVYVYKRIYVQVSSWMRKNKANNGDIEDILQDSLIVLYKLVRNKDATKVNNIEAYLFKVCKNLWLRRLQKSGREFSTEKLPVEIPQMARGQAALEESEKQNALLSLLDQLGVACKEILNYYYFDRMNMKDIATHMGYSNEQVAKNKKSTCLKKVRQLVEKAPELQNILKSY